MIVTVVSVSLKGRLRKARMILQIETLLEELRGVTNFSSMYSARLENKRSAMQSNHHVQHRIKKARGVLLMQRMTHPLTTRANMRDIALCKMFLKERFEKNTNKLTFWAFLHKGRYLKNIEFLLNFLKNLQADMLVNQNITAN